MPGITSHICVLTVTALSFCACHKPSSDPPPTNSPFALTDTTTGIHVEVSQQDALPALKILLPGQPASDPGVRVLFPEHVTAREHGKTDAAHLYIFQPGSVAPGSGGAHP